MVYMALNSIVGIAVFNSTIRESCDLTEYNRFLDKNGNEVFTQLIFWHWNEQEQRYQVRAWTMRENVKHIYHRDGYTVVRYADKEHSCERVMTSNHYRESETQHDPEREDLKRLPNSELFALVKKLVPQ